jgi:hypothetical protein
VQALQSSIEDRRCAPDACCEVAGIHPLPLPRRHRSPASFTAGGRAALGDCGAAW